MRKRITIPGDASQEMVDEILKREGFDLEKKITTSRNINTYSVNYEQEIKE